MPDFPCRQSGSTVACVQCTQVRTYVCRCKQVMYRQPFFDGLFLLQYPEYIRADWCVGVGERRGVGRDSKKQRTYFFSFDARVTPPSG